jgi:hypothetical protein
MLLKSPFNFTSTEFRPIDPARKHYELRHFGPDSNPANRNPAQTNNGVLRTSLETGFRRYDLCTVCSLTSISIVNDGNALLADEIGTFRRKY